MADAELAEAGTVSLTALVSRSRLGVTSPLVYPYVNVARRAAVFGHAQAASAAQSRGVALLRRHAAAGRSPGADVRPPARRRSENEKGLRIVSTNLL
jgi:hypothetical protein